MSQFFIFLYSPVIRWALKYKKTVILLNVLALAVAIFLYAGLGREFMPSLDEGSLLYMPTTLPPVSMTEAKRLITVQDSIIKTVPEVDHVLGKVGRADSATDPAPVSMFETLILLKPKDKWRPGLTKADIMDELSGKLKIPGVSEGWTQPIINRIQMMNSGVRTDIGVKIMGNDLPTLNALALQAQGILEKVPGAADLYAERVTGGEYLDIKVDREAAARYGLKAGDVQEIIESAIGGMDVTRTVEGRERFPVVVRYARDFRDNLDALQRVQVPVNEGKTHIPLAELASIKVDPGPDMISSEDGLLRSVVYLNVRGRDMGSFMEEAKAKLDAGLKLPPGYYVNWSGTWENQVRASKAS